MRKAIFIILLFFAWRESSAPGRAEMCIAESKSITYDPILFAFMEAESNFRTDVVNHLGYTGILQIGQEMITDANRIQKNHVFTLSDALDSTKSVQIWYIMQNHYNRSYTLKNACRIWNSTASEKYIEKIQRIIDRNQINSL